MGFEIYSDFHYSYCGFGAFTTTTDVAIPVTQILQKTIYMPNKSVATAIEFYNCKKTRINGI